MNKILQFLNKYKVIIDITINITMRCVGIIIQHFFK